MSLAIVIPTIGRPSLTRLLSRLECSAGPRPDHIVLVDDRPDPAGPLDHGSYGWVRDAFEVRRSAGRGPAAARNVGWRTADARWIAFLDDDVEVSDTWLADLARDLQQPADVAGSQGRIRVPLPDHRRPTDWERGTAGLADARWITADMAYRKDALAEVRGFDERFRRAFREDSDIALRILATGAGIAAGERVTVHPVRPARWDTSLRQQRGNRDDALMRALHGSDWYERAGATRGARRRHMATTAAALAGLAGAALGSRAGFAAGTASWAAFTARFAAERMRPGPRDRRELAAMIATSVAIPPVATWHLVLGTLAHRRARPWAEVAPVPAAVLLDRDGTLIRDVPYNGDPSRVEPMPGAAAALEALRLAGVPIGIVTNQSAVARGRITLAQVRAVNQQVEHLLGAMDTWQVCPHDSEAGCGCRKPAPGLIRAASAALGVDVAACVVIGDTEADVKAAEAAGARGVLVPNETTRAEEIDAARWVCPTIDEAVERVLAGRL